MAAPAAAEDVVERTLCQIPVVHVFKIPTLRSASGHRAADWKQEIWQGRLRVVQRGSEAAVILSDAAGAIFAVCPVDAEGAVERCADSSRYFALKIQSAQGRHAFIGVAFNDRNESFDFSVALQEHKKDVDREQQLEETGGPDLAPQHDYSLKQGQKITIALRPKTHPEGEDGADTGGSDALSSARQRREQQRAVAGAGGGGGGGGGRGLLAPPPSDTRSRRRPAARAGPVGASAAAVPTPTASADPFGGTSAAAADPFGGTSAAAAGPFGGAPAATTTTTTAAASDDPFGGSSAPMAAAAPAAAVSDPFGSATLAAAPAAPAAAGGGLLPTPPTQQQQQQQVVDPFASMTAAPAGGMGGFASLTQPQQQPQQQASQQQQQPASDPFGDFLS